VGTAWRREAPSFGRATRQALKMQDDGKSGTCGGCILCRTANYRRHLVLTAISDALLRSIRPTHFEGENSFWD
jgi:hypothetical protein